MWEDVEEICRKTVSHGQTVKLYNLNSKVWSVWIQLHVFYFLPINRNFQMAFLKWIYGMFKKIGD